MLSQGAVDAVLQLLAATVSSDSGSEQHPWQTQACPHPCFTHALPVMLVLHRPHADIKVTLKRNTYEPDCGELTQKATKYEMQVIVRYLQRHTNVS